MMLILFLSACSMPQYNYLSIDDNKLKINLDGYFYICAYPSVYVKENEAWRLIKSLPPKGQYYIDDQYYSYGTCDYSTCTKLPKPQVIELVEYEKVGDKEALDSKGYMAPVYKAIDLKDNIKVEFEYFTDEQCKNKKFFSEEIKR